MDIVRWRLKDYLREHDLTEEALVQASKLSPRLVHALTAAEAEQVRLETLAGLLNGLRTLTGTEVALSDVLVYVTDDDVDNETDDETDVLLASGAADLQRQLDDLERDVPPGELDTWLKAFYTTASKNAG